MRADWQRCFGANNSSPKPLATRPPPDVKLAGEPAGRAAAWSFGRYPVDIDTRPLRLVFTCGFPMAAVTTWPARMPTAGPDLAAIILGLGITGLFVGTSVGRW